LSVVTVTPRRAAVHIRFVYEEANGMRTTMRSRSLWLIGVVALLAVLTLSACGARGGQPSSGSGSTGNSAQTTQQSGSHASVDSSLQAVATADQAVQDADSAHSSTQTDAALDYASHDGETQP
jgi:hypothetical protein